MTAILKAISSRQLFNPDDQSSVKYQMILSGSPMFSRETIGGNITARVNGSIYTSSILDVINSTLAIVSPIISGSRYVEFTTSEFTMSYNAEPSYSALIGISRSYASIDAYNLGTFAGDIRRIKTFVKSIDSIGNYEQAGDVLITPNDLTITESTAQQIINVPMGVIKNQSVINKYWSEGTIDNGIYTVFVQLDMEDWPHHTFTATTPFAPFTPAAVDEGTPNPAGDPPYIFSISPSSLPLPDGMELDVYGTIRGPASASEGDGVEYQYILRATDYASPIPQYAEDYIYITVNPELKLTILSSFKYLAGSSPFIPFVPISASGGTLELDGRHLSYAISPGLPDGLIYDTTNGEISGLPSPRDEQITRYYTVTVTDALLPPWAAVTSSMFELTVNPDLKLMKHPDLLPPATTPLKFTASPPTGGPIPITTNLWYDTFTDTDKLLNSHIPDIRPIGELWNDYGITARVCTASGSYGVPTTPSWDAILPTAFIGINDNFSVEAVVTIGPGSGSGLSDNDGGIFGRGRTNTGWPYGPEQLRYYGTRKTSTTVALGSAYVAVYGGGTGGTITGYENYSWPEAVAKRMRMTFVGNTLTYFIADADGSNEVQVNSGPAAINYNDANHQRAGFLFRPPLTNGTRGQSRIDNFKVVSSSILPPIITGQVAPFSFSSSVADGGTIPYTWFISSSLPTSMSMSSGSGVIYGPSVVTSSATTYTVTVDDISGPPPASASINLSMLVNPPLITSTSIAIKSLTQGTSYTAFQPVIASYGTPYYYWSTKPTLPAGMVVTPIGAQGGYISGIPTEAVTSQLYELIVSDSSFKSPAINSSSTFVLTVSPPLALSNISYYDQWHPKELTALAAYIPFAPVTATGGTLPLTWGTASVTPPLPIGMMIDSSSGMISGTPTNSSSVTAYTITVHDALSTPATATKDFYMTVYPQLSASVQQPYTVMRYGDTFNPSITPVIAIGGKPPLSWSVSPNISAGLSFDGSGKLSGTPAVSTSNAYNDGIVNWFTASVHDALPIAPQAIASGTFSIKIMPPIKTTRVQPSRTITALANYSTYIPITAIGGAAALQWLVTELPHNMIMNSSTGEITGQALAGDGISHTYYVTVTDGHDEKIEIIDLTVNPAVVATLNPPLSRSFTQGMPYPAFQPVVGSEGTGVLTYSASLAVPTGMLFNTNTGYISNTATAPINATYLITVTDTLNAYDSESFHLIVNSPMTTSVASPSTRNLLRDGLLISPFKPINVSNGTSPYHWSLNPSPPMPETLGIDYATGNITGSTHSASALTTYTVIVSDSVGATSPYANSTRQFNLKVYDHVKADVKIATQTLVNNKVITPFIPVSGSYGLPPITYVADEGVYGPFNAVVGLAFWASGSASVLVGAYADPSASILSPLPAPNNLYPISFTSNIDSTVYENIGFSNITATADIYYNKNNAGWIYAGNLYQWVVTELATYVGPYIIPVSYALPLTTKNVILSGIIPTDTLEFKISSSAILNATDCTIDGQQIYFRVDSLSIGRDQRLPTGVYCVASNGQISGSSAGWPSPAEITGTRDITIKVKDSGDSFASPPIAIASASKSFTLTLNNPLNIGNSGTRTFISGTSYTDIQSVGSAWGGILPYTTYNISPSLPAGLNWNSSNGTISGIPSAASPLTLYTVTVYDSDTQPPGANAASGTFSIQVADVLKLTPATSVSAFYLWSSNGIGISLLYYPHIATGGITPYRYTLSVNSRSGNQQSYGITAATGAVWVQGGITGNFINFNMTVYDATETSVSAPFSVNVT